MSNKKSNRLEWIDFAKGIGIYLLVLGHMPSLPVLFTDWIYSFHMPLFFFLSGYVFNNKRKYSFICEKAFIHLIVPYLCYNVIFLLIDIVLFGKTSKVVLDDCNNVISGQGAFGVIWFLLALFWVQLIYGLICKITKKKLRYCVVIFIVIWGYIMSMLINFECYKLITAMVALGFFAIGDYLKVSHKEFEMNNRVSFIIILGASVGLSLINSNAYKTRIEMSGAIYNNLVLTYSCAVFGIQSVVMFSEYVLKKMSTNLNKFFKSISKITIYIGEHSIYFFPLTAYIPVRLVEYCGMYIKINIGMKILSKIVGFILTYFIIVFVEFLKRKINRKVI